MQIIIRLFLLIVYILREEVQQVLEKVTDQLEHQYTAHQELEKLRLKQEAMLLREKERQV